MTALREVRVDRLLSIRDLARKAAVAPSTVYLIEAGRTSPSLRSIRRLAAALEIDASEVNEFQLAIGRSRIPSRPHAPMEEYIAPR